MLLRKFHIVFFRDCNGQCYKLRLHGWMVLAIITFLAGLIGGNLYLWRYFHEYGVVEGRLGIAEKTVQEQKTQMLSLASKMKILEKDLYRVRDFDSKLRIMINLDHQQPQLPTQVGGPETRDFSKNYLTMYRQELLARKMHNFLYQLSTDARLEEARQQELIQTLREREDMLAATPSIWPVEGWISSSFGYRTSPFTGKREFHKGLDISCPLGTPIYSPAKGVVVNAGRRGAYGLRVSIDHGAGTITRYGHMHRISVKPGQTVTRGELVGYVGTTGRSTGPHLHYEVRLNGLPVDPMRYILN
jgi:murein DD-endopeptidase MepM/ murein hydrolase activator NlpD